MPKYRVLQRSFIDNRIREEGDVIDYTPPVDGTKEFPQATVISDNLELIEEPKPAKAAKAPAPAPAPAPGSDLT